MLTSGPITTKDHRLACGETEDSKPQIFLNGCKQHYTASDAGITVYVNTTTVPTYLSTGPELIAPYARPDGGVHYDTCGTPESPLCGPWSGSVPPNTYTASAQTMSVAACHKSGFQNAVATKVWHGSYGFNECMLSCAENGNTTHSIKYLTVTYEGYYYECNITYSYVQSWGETISVDRGSGTSSVSNCYLSGSRTMFPGGETTITYLDPEGITFECMTTIPACSDDPSWIVYYKSIADGDYTVVDTHKSASHYDFDVKFYRDLYPPPDYLPVKTLMKHLKGSTTLSDPYTLEDLEEDVDGLLSKWTFKDNLWRTGSNCALAPLLTFDEYPNPIMAYPNYYPCDYFDSGSLIFTGAILGEPKPIGYDPFWDFRHVNWQDMGGWYQIDSYGALCPAELKIATQWTNGIEQRRFHYGCGFTSINEIQNDVGGILYPDTLIKGKYAQILETYPSYNFARPCGLDRYAIDHTTASWCGATDGTQIWTLYGLYIPDHTECIVEVDGYFDGGYILSSIHPWAHNIESQVWSWPSGSEAYKPFYYNTMVGKVRFPDAGGICGRTKILSLKGTPVTCSTADMTYLRDNDTVVISGIPSFNAGTANVSVISSTSFSLIGTSYTGSMPTSSVYVQSSNSGSDYRWNDTTSKGDFTVTTYDYNLWDSTMTSSCIQDCHTLSPCNIHSACITNNIEQLNNTTSHSLDKPTVGLNIICGALWKAKINDSMDDPLWQTPMSYNPTLVPGVNYPASEQAEARCYYPTASFGTPTTHEFITLKQPGPDDECYVMEVDI